MWEKVYCLIIQRKRKFIIIGLLICTIIGIGIIITERKRNLSVNPDYDIENDYLGKDFFLWIAGITVPPEDNPLDRAIRENNLPEVKSLIERGTGFVNVNLERETAFAVACKYGQVAIFEYLISPEAGIIDEKWRDLAWEAFFVDAAEYGQISMMEEAVKQGVDLNNRNIVNIPLVDWALWKAAESWQPEAVQWLIDHNGNVNQQNSYENLKLSSENEGFQRSEIVRAFIAVFYRRYQNQSIITWCNETPLKRAIYSRERIRSNNVERQLNTVNALLRAGAKIDTDTFSPYFQMGEERMSERIYDVLKQHITRNHLPDPEETDTAVSIPIQEAIRDGIL